MRGVKARSGDKGVKVLHRTVRSPARLKEASVRGTERAREKAREKEEPRGGTPTGYAIDKTRGAARRSAGAGVRHFENPGAKARENMERAKGHFAEAKRNLPKERARAATEAGQTARTAKGNAETLRSFADDARKNAGEAKAAVAEAKQVSREARLTGKRAIRTVKERGKAARSGGKKRGLPDGANPAKGNAARKPPSLAHGKTASVVPITTGKAAYAAPKAGKPANASAVNLHKGGISHPNYVGKGVSAPKGAVKTAKKSVKTTERSAKAAVKTARGTAKAANQTARKTARTAKAAEKAAFAASKAAVKTTRAAAKAVRAMVKISIAAIKGLVALVAAGGWMALAVILLICVIGLLLGSIFGIFFSGEDAGTGHTMPSVIAELTDEFYAQVEEIKAANPHDVLEMEPVAINWPEVLAVYAVRVSTDPNGADVATLDEDKIEKLREILHDMVWLSYYLRTDTYTTTSTNSDGEATTETVTIVTLVITLNQKGAEEMTEEYRFSNQQQAQTRELLHPEYASLWARLLGGYVAGVDEILTGSVSRIPNSALSWPMVNNYPVTSGFGYRQDPFTGEITYHGGIDMAAPRGTPILAAADGVVDFANSTDAWGGGYGYYVRIQHEGGTATLYAHASAITVVIGQEVRKGQVVAYVGSTGRSTGNHLHWEVYQDGERKDPLDYFD